MTALNAAAKAALSAAQISRPAWARHHGDDDGHWRGDACGCPDDRCIGYHHDETDECGCLAVLLDEYDGPRKPGAWWL